MTDDVRDPGPSRSSSASSRTVEDIYDLYGLSAHLRRHMLRAGAIAGLIGDSWSGPPLDWPGIIRYMLIHDIGDVVSDEDAVEGAETPATADLRHRSAGNRHEARLLVAEFVGLSPSELSIMRDSGLSNLHRSLAAGNLAPQIAGYCDSRQNEDSVLPLTEAQARNRVRFPDFYARPGMTEALNTMIAFEKRIASWCRRPLDSITDATVAPVMEQLKVFNL